MISQISPYKIHSYTHLELSWTVGCWLGTGPSFCSLPKKGEDNTVIQAYILNIHLFPRITSYHHIKQGCKELGCRKDHFWIQEASGHRKGEDIGPCEGRSEWFWNRELWVTRELGRWHQELWLDRTHVTIESEDYRNLRILYTSFPIQFIKLR